MYVCGWDTRCSCPGTPRAEVLGSDHAMNTAEQDEARPRVFTPNHYLPNQSVKGTKAVQTSLENRSAPSTYSLFVNTLGAGGLTGLTFSRTTSYYQHELENLPSSVIALGDESIHRASQRQWTIARDTAHESWK